MLTPRTDDLPRPLAAAARAIATRLAEAGHRAWIVGGAVRDLALARPVHDVDLVSAARPDEVQRLFPHTIAVGAAFGIVVVVQDGLEVEVATFREERGYSDSRRPDEVRYAEAPGVDALRRDFTCNALYLDPLDDTLADPTGGLADLAAGRLGAVGDAGARFREDGLRLLRMARFEAALALTPAPGLHEAARGALAALRGVSPERVLDELSKVLRGERAGVALRVLERCGIAEIVVPGHGELGAAEREARLRVLDGHGAVRGEDGGLAVGLAALCAPSDGDVAHFEREAPALRARLVTLRLSRATLSATLEVARTAAGMADLAASNARPSARLRALRSPWFDAALDLAVRRARAAGRDEDALGALAQWRAHAADPAPTPFVGAADVAAAGVPPGPEFGALLEEAEDLQLDGVLPDRPAALRWLAGRAAAT